MKYNHILPKIPDSKDGRTLRNLIHRYNDLDQYSLDRYYPGESKDVGAIKGELRVAILNMIENISTGEEVSTCEPGELMPYSRGDKSI